MRQAAAILLALLLFGPHPAGAQPVHAIAMHGEPAYPPGFDHFAYANPAAPQGGRLTLSLPGTFDSLNPFIVKGSSTAFIRNNVVESLMVRGFDEPFTLYGQLAQSVETDPQRSFVTFTLDPRARFSDGTPVTADDVVFSYQLLREKGRPNHRLYYGKIARAEILAERVVRFDFQSPDRELPLIMGLMPVFARHATDPAKFEETSLKPPLGSGPYKVVAVEPGASVTLAKDPSYWGRDLPTNRGFNNFSQLRFDYFREQNSEFEAFKRRLVDVRFESDPGRWETGYDFPAARAGEVIREVIPTGLPKPHYALVFNTRRAVFADVRVRRAIIELFDFAWLDRNFYHGLYARTAGFFDGSELSAIGRKADAAERAMLAAFPGAVRADVLEGTYAPPAADGTGRDRLRLKAALDLFAEAGWQLKDAKLRRTDTGEPMRFEIMVTTREQERLCLAFASQLARAGIAANVRIVDAVQFDARRNSYDFDMVPFVWGQSLSPGNEQAFYFGSAAADQPGTRNYMGMKSAAADTLIAAMIAANSRADLVAASRALDRVLISGAYGVPLFHAPGQWLARWSSIHLPGQASLYGTLPETWWHTPQ
ncbi:extracellular solute-binding protein [Roseixanthobacter pseudopolyaromaticivorans]|uniref:extracellular solute-binding protein n=1 Tax=Xanthobacteraceae TaxID=335928 RepID=UPI00372C8B37